MNFLCIKVIRSTVNLCNCHSFDSFFYSFVSEKVSRIGFQRGAISSSNCNKNIKEKYCKVLDYTAV